MASATEQFVRDLTFKELIVLGNLLGSKKWHQKPQQYSGRKDASMQRKIRAAADKIIGVLSGGEKEGCILDLIKKEPYKEVVNAKHNEEETKRGSVDNLLHNLMNAYNKLEG